MESFTDNVNATALKDINKVFDEYSKAIVWTYLGKQDMVKEENFIQPVNLRTSHTNLIFNHKKPAIAGFLWNKYRL